MINITYRYSVKNGIGMKIVEDLFVCIRFNIHIMLMELFVLKFILLYIIWNNIYLRKIRLQYMFFFNKFMSVLKSQPFLIL